MNERAPRMGWVPPFMVGTAAAVAAEVAATVLLYEGLGFLRSLTTILAVEGGAFAAGLWSAPRDDQDLTDRLRQRWLLCLVAFLAAALFGTVWSLTSWLEDAAWAQGVGLAIMGGLPAYGAGAVLGGLAMAARTDPGRRLRPPGPAAMAGAAAGVVLTGFLLPRAPMPSSLLVACLVLLSLGGMVFGSVLESRTQIDVKATRPGRAGDVRVEERSVLRDRESARLLIEGEYVRRRVDLSGQSTASWDVALARAMMPALAADPHGARPWKVLHIGGGASLVARTVLREHPVGSVDVVERVGAVIELGRDHFDTELTVSQTDRRSVRVGNLDDVLEDVLEQGADDVGSTYDVIVIDTRALAALGGVLGLSTASRRRIVNAVSPAGIVAWGPLPIESGRPEVPETWDYSERRSGTGEHIILTRPSGGAEWPGPVEGFETMATTDPGETAAKTDGVTTVATDGGSATSTDGGSATSTYGGSATSADDEAAATTDRNP